MLVRFVVSNFLSFGEETEFNMLTGNVRRKPEHVSKHGGIELLKTAAIYGPNGAGKSNLVEAIEFLKEILRGEEYFTVPFKLDKKKKTEPTQFEIEFIVNGQGYSYGVSVFEDKIVEEWLFLTDDEQEELIFNRKTIHSETTIDTSENFKKTEEDKLRIKLYADELLQNSQTLISLLAKAKGTTFNQVKEAYDWLLDGIVLISPFTRYSQFPLTFYNNETFKTYVEEIIGTLNTGVVKLHLETIDIDVYFGEDNRNLANTIKARLEDNEEDVLIPVIGSDQEPPMVIAVCENNKPVIKQLVTQHFDKEQNLVNFRLEEESDGTRRLMDFIPAFYSIMTENTTIIIDEIDQSIHPALLKKLVAKFADNPNTKGQLIFTTHESNLLDQDIFRQDEIWFAEKKKTGETTLYPLSDYKIRYDLDIEKGYLNGRFGAMPFLGNLDDLNWEDYAAKEA